MPAIDHRLRQGQDAGKISSKARDAVRQAFITLVLELYGMGLCGAGELYRNTAHTRPGTR